MCAGRQLYNDGVPMDDDDDDDTTTMMMEAEIPKSQCTWPRNWLHCNVISTTTLQARENKKENINRAGGSSESEKETGHRHWNRFSGVVRARSLTPHRHAFWGLLLLRSFNSPRGTLFPCRLESGRIGRSLGCFP